LIVIKSFRDRDTQRVFERDRVRRWSPALQRSALRKLLILDAADELRDLRSPPGNRLEKLTGDRAGEYGIRVNDQWRVCFRWTDGHAHDVEMVDYH
jgi:proteic killer suppression protein